MIPTLQRCTMSLKSRCGAYGSATTLDTHFYANPPPRQAGVTPMPAYRLSQKSTMALGLSSGSSNEVADLIAKATMMAHHSAIPPMPKRVGGPSAFPTPLSACGQCLNVTQMRATLTWHLCTTPDNPTRRHHGIAIGRHYEEQGGLPVLPTPSSVGGQHPKVAHKRATSTRHRCAKNNNLTRRHLDIAIASHDDEQGGHLGTLPRCQPATKSLRCAEARDASIRRLCTKNDNATRCSHGIAIARHGIAITRHGI